MTRRNEGTVLTNLRGFCNFATGVAGITRERSEISLCRLQGNPFKPLAFLTTPFFGDKALGDRMASNVLTEARREGVCRVVTLRIWGDHIIFFDRNCAAYVYNNYFIYFRNWFAYSVSQGNAYV